MARRIFKALYKLAIGTCVLVALLCLPACLVPYVSAARYPLIALLGLAFPVLALLLVFFLFLFLLRRSKWALLPLAILLACGQQLSVLVAPRISNSVLKKEAGVLRVLTWNVSWWDEMNRESRGGKSYRDAMLQFVKEQDADVLCFQEFFQPHASEHFAPNIKPLEEMGYTYHYFYPTLTMFDGKWQTGVAIFSRHPVIDTAGTGYGADVTAEGLIYADINWQGKVVRVITTHLESVLFKESDYQGVEALKGRKRVSVKASKTIAGKLKRGYQRRSGQAEKAARFIKQSPHPVVFCADLNDVPTSYTYFTVKGALQDAFLKKGAGIGRTFRHLSPTLRIDYILADKRLQVKNFYNGRVPFSDHYPLVADLSY